MGYNVEYKIESDKQFKGIVSSCFLCLELGKGMKLEYRKGLGKLSFSLNFHSNSFILKPCVKRELFRLLIALQQHSYDSKFLTNHTLIHRKKKKKTDGEK
jgi:hypothetical protein